MEAALKKIKVLALDVDGVLTDGSLTMSEQGEVIKCFYVKDGLGLSVAQRQGLRVVLVTGRASSILHKRAEELKLTALYENVKDKAAALRQVAQELNVALAEIAFVGDDLIDLPALNLAGVSFAPQDAAEEVCHRVDYVLTKAGGRGAVREVIEIILKAQGLWQEVVESYQTAGQGDRQ